VSRNGWKCATPTNKIAIWTYYKGAVRDPASMRAPPPSHTFHKGWFWYIPLAGDVVSAGIVAEKDYLYNGSQDPKEIFHREVGNNKWVEQHLAVGEQFGPYRVTGNTLTVRVTVRQTGWSDWRCIRVSDPVFSSECSSRCAAGMRGGRGGPGVDRRGLLGARFENYGADMCRGIEGMRRLVYAFYDHAFSFRTFVNTYPDLAGDLTDCLIGNLFIDFDPLFNAVAEFARVPAPLPHDLPLVAAR
jgi:hypothetical protein